MKKSKILDFIKEKECKVMVGAPEDFTYEKAILVDDLMKFINKQENYKGII